MSIKQWINKMRSIHKIIFLRCIKESSIDICHKADKDWKHYAR